MKRILRLSPQVITFALRQAPQPRRMLKQALAQLREEKGDIQALEANLAGYHRLRVGRFRVIIKYLPDNVIDAIFVEERALVYEVFEVELAKKLINK